VCIKLVTWNKSILRCTVRKTYNYLCPSISISNSCLRRQVFFGSRCRYVAAELSVFTNVTERWQQ